MSDKRERNEQNNGFDTYERSDNLRDSPMMAHLLEALEEGEDIGHYGRLTFTMIARHFMENEEIVSLLAQQPDMDEQESRALVLQVDQHDYNPPRRERILEWQEQQEFPICPTPEDPNSCNVYRELRFPDEIYSQIDQFWESKVNQEDE